MNNDSLEEFCREDSTEWSFPDLELFIKADIDAMSSNKNETKQKNDEQSPDVDKINNKKLCDLILENERLESDYQKKIEFLDTLITRLENPLSMLDKDMLELIQLIVKSAVKKIIYKELKSDTKLLNKIIAELTALLDAHDGLFTVILSQQDYNRLISDYDKSSMILKSNSALSEGDIIIKSNFTEIHAILNDRINQVLGTRKCLMLMPKNT